jgi:mono/diheme cytochrome c family protein
VAEVKPGPGGRRLVVWAIGAGLAVVVAGVGYAYLTALSGGGRADIDDAEQVALGGQVYTEACAACHGENLEGQPDWRLRNAEGRLPAPPHDETGHTWHHPDPMLFEMTKLGVEALAPAGYQSDMPGFADDLSDEEIWAVLAYIKSTWPPNIRDRQADMTKSYEAN